jgi:equilibrative nucleoside transporter 1/2/3
LKKTEKEPLEESSIIAVDAPFPNLIQVSTLIKVPLLCLFVNFCITMSLYPAITSNIQSLDGKENFVAFHFLIFTLFDWIGKSVPAFTMLRIKSTKTTMYATSLRLLFLPMALVCNIVLVKNSRPLVHPFPVYLSDEAYFCFLALLSSSSGYLNSICFIQAAEQTMTQFGFHESTMSRSADAMVFSLTFGLMVGSLCSFGVYSISCQCNPF